jgi:hypothetical protein
MQALAVHHHRWSIQVPRWNGAGLLFIEYAEVWKNARVESAMSFNLHKKETRMKSRCEGASKLRAVVHNGRGFGPLAGVLFLTAFSSYVVKAQDQPLVTLVAPVFNNTYSGSTVQVEAQFGAGADPSTFVAQVNGIDITNMFSGSGNCGASGLCNLQAYVPDVDLLNGTNIITADVAGPNDSVGTSVVKFQFAPPDVGDTNPISKMIPSISIQSVRLPANADPNQTSSYQMVLGPGPGFPEKIYTPYPPLNCTAGINSMQVLVLTRQTLVPDTKAGSSGRACLFDANGVVSFLKTVPKGDLVIVNTFLGLMANLDTTAMGGTKFAGSGISPHYYNAIGVAGAPAGTAYESYQANANHTHRLGRAFLPPLVGSLMLDTNQDYYFVPSSYPEVQVVPGKVSNNNCATITYGGAPYNACASGNTLGGFFIVAVDRLLDNATDQYILPTNNSSLPVSRQAISDLTFLLDVYYKHNDLLIITTFGTPIGSSAPVTSGLYFAIARLGGNGYLLPKLNTTGSAYTLISSGDPDYVRAHYPVESSTASGGSGQLHSLLSKDRSNRLVMNTGASDQVLNRPIGFQWTAVGFQQAQDWPAWTTGEQNAYLDLTSSANHYPAIRAMLGCPGANVCQPIRTYYDGGIGASGTAPAIVSFPYHTLTYFSNPDYSLADFDAVIDQLSVEGGYESNVYLAYALFTKVTTNASTSLQYQLSQVVKTINSSVLKGNYGSSPLVAHRLAQAGAVTALFSLLPAVGPAFGAVSMMFNATAAFVPSGNGGVPDYSRYAFTLDQLTEQASSVGQSLANGTNKLFTGIVNDWGKLAIIGPGIGSSQSPWKMCTTCAGSNVPEAALPAFALAAKRQFYLQLLPTVYSSDAFVDLNTTDLGKVGRQVIKSGKLACFYPYANAPNAAISTYPSINKPTTWNINIITQTAMTYQDPTYSTLSFPSSGLLTDLFNPPATGGANPNYTLAGGGAGINMSQLLPSGGYLAPRAAYLPGIKKELCGNY